MSTTAERLNLLLDTKADIKAALIEKGQAAGDVFSTYADKIRAIPSEIVASDDGNGNVTITMAAATVTHDNGDVTIS